MPLYVSLFFNSLSHVTIKQDMKDSQILNGFLLLPFILSPFSIAAFFLRTLHFILNLPSQEACLPPFTTAPQVRVGLWGRHTFPKHYSTIPITFHATAYTVLEYSTLERWTDSLSNILKQEIFSGSPIHDQRSAPE